MSAKTSARRRAAFFKALEETGNITVSAERAKVSRSWVRLRRKGDAGFEAACAAALRQARDRLATHAERKPPSGWGHLDGEELVVRGSGGAAGPGRRVQIARARARQWTPRVETRFLATLAATCNVKAACAEAGMSIGSAYAHRRRWRAFAERWDEAIETGYTRIEIALVENGCNLFSAPELPPEAPIPPMSVDQAIHVLHMHKHEARGMGRRPGRRGRPPSLDDVRDSIMRKVEAIRRGSDVSEAEREQDERAWARRREVADGR